MKTGRYPICLIFIFLFCFIISGLFAQDSAKIETPESYFGFKPGADRMLFTYEDLISYLQKVDEKSPRLKMVEIGQSPQGRPMYIAFLSSAENIANLDKLKNINRQLALNPKLSEDDKNMFIREGRVFLLGTLSMHSGEVGPSQAAPLIAYDLVTTEATDMLKWLNDVVYMMVPCHNPDGMNMVVNHYNKYKGTKYEGSSLPGVYHKYVGHDNNRDFVILSQKDTKAIAAIYNKTWFPQVMVEKHQMGSTGPRYFVPPMHDPIAENIDADIWTWTTLFGSNLIKHMTNQGLTGVSQHYLFDDYWPGSTETCLWKNVIGMLTECASAHYAKPIYIEPNELRVNGKGLSEYKKSINMPVPWPGGWWRLSDIIEYEIASTNSLIETSSLYREKILNFRNDICKKEVQKGKTEAPYYYIFPADQHDNSELVNLINLLDEHGVEVYRLTETTIISGREFKENDIVVPLSQPFRPFIKEVLETQEYPVRHYTPGGKIIKPYDITSWSLPLHRGITCFEINQHVEEWESGIQIITMPFKLNGDTPKDYWAAVFNVNHNESFNAVFWAQEEGLEVQRIMTSQTVGQKPIPAGSFLIENSSEALNVLIHELSVSPLYLNEKSEIKMKKIRFPKIALVETFFHDMDAGWTRFVFDQYHIPFQVIRPGDFKDINLAKKYDLVIFPDSPKSILMEGKWKSENDYSISSYPPQYTKGIGKEGMKKLMMFLEQGGVIIAWGRSTRLFNGMLEIPNGNDQGEQFQLPFNDISGKLGKEGLYFPGSLVKIDIVPHLPLTYGLPPEIGVFYRGRPVFTTSIPRFDMDRRVIARFPEKNILLSGYAENEKKVVNKTAAVWLRKGKGQLVLFTFGPQFRASTQASYKLLFNALLLKNHS
jgi:hypothetical protein